MAQEGKEEGRVDKLVQTSSPRIEHEFPHFIDRIIVEFGSPTSNLLIILTKSNSFR